ncbi:MAG: DUF4390 domain-containing protein [Gammaproteobacteria bacterium WSBS_2016_MAG_OTU1]
MRRAILLLLFCFIPSSAVANEHGFLVNNLWFKESERGYSLRASLSAGPEEVIGQLLNSGYMVRLKFDMRFMRSRNWLPDKEIGDISWAPQISFDSLLNRYTFSAGGMTEEFDNLPDALTRVQRLRAAPVKDAQLSRLLKLPDIYIVARYELLVSHLPQPLQVSLLTSEWEIDSGWQRFVVEVRP